MRQVRRVAQVVAGRFHLAIDAALVQQAVDGPLPLLPLPRVPPAVLGACAVRGVMVPVFDIAALLDPAREITPQSTLRQALLLRHGTGQFLLPIDTLSGMRAVDAAQLAEVEVQSPTADRVFSQLIVGDEQFPPSVLLDVEALLRVGDLHQAIAPRGTEASAERGEAKRPYLIVRAGHLVFAMQSTVVRGVEVRDPALERAFAHPVLKAFRVTQNVPHAVVDLLALIGQQSTDAQEPASHIIMVGDGDGSNVALLVDQLLGFDTLVDAELHRAPDLGHADPTLCRGVLDSARHGRVLVLDDAALLRAARVIDVNTLLSVGDVHVQEAVASTQANYMVYAAGGGLLASPISDLFAVTVVPRDYTDLRHDGTATIGMLSHGGQSVPVTDLGVLLGKPPLVDPVGKPVLIVTTPRGPVAFAVERVLFMRLAEARRVPHMALRAHGMAPPFTSTIVVEDAGAERAAAVLALMPLATRIAASPSTSHAA